MRRLNIIFGKLHPLVVQYVVAKHAYRNMRGVRMGKSARQEQTNLTCQT